MISKKTIARNVLLVTLISVFLVMTVNCSTTGTEEPVTEGREGFSIREISDDLFDRMKTGNTYKRKFLSDR